MVVFLVLDLMIEFPISYYETFFIEEKYGLNHKNKKEFFKDEFLEQGLNTVLLVILGSFIVYLCTPIESWTNHFTITYRQSFLF